jgi:2-methylcitrate dehydratase PrpD
MKRVALELDAGIDAAFPAQRAARVAIEARDGRRGEHLQPTRKGDPDLPLSDAELEAKYLELAAPVLGEEKARALLARLWKLERESRL